MPKLPKRTFLSRTDVRAHGRTDLRVDGLILIVERHRFWKRKGFSVPHTFYIALYNICKLYNSTVFASFFHRPIKSLLLQVVKRYFLILQQCLIHIIKILYKHFSSISLEQAQDNFVKFSLRKQKRLVNYRMLS